MQAFSGKPPREKPQNEAAEKWFRAAECLDSHLRNFGPSKIESVEPGHVSTSSGIQYSSKLRSGNIDPV